MAEEPTEEGQEPEPSPETFDREYVEKLRKEAATYRTKLKELEPIAQKAKELEDAQKSEAEKMTERLTTAERRAQEAELALLRTQVAVAKGLTPTQAKRLSGATQEELEADADDLLESFKPSEDPVQRDGKPKENLRPGGDPDDDDIDDPEAIADRILARRTI